MTRRTRRRGGGGEEEERRTRQEEEEEATDIKSNNPHLAGGELRMNTEATCTSPCIITQRGAVVWKTENRHLQFR